MLPKIILPQYTITLPVSRNVVVFRAYTAREEKILLIAKEAGEPEQIPTAIKQIISNCTGIENPDKLCQADRDFIVVQLRSKVSGNIETLHYTCKKNKKDGSLCNTALEVDIDLNNVEIQQPIKSGIIQLTKDIGIEFKIPTIADENLIASMDDVEYEVDKLYYKMFACLVSIYDKNTVTGSDDISFREFEDWILELPSDSYEKITNFFENIPYISYKTNIVCPTCKAIHPVELKGIDDFFRS